ncbi:MAG: hypothetical protein AAFW89_07105 [Bacteroidota bacterium]
MKTLLIRALLVIAGSSLLLFVPLVRDLHFESAMLAGIVGCLGAGVFLSRKKRGSDLLTTLRWLGWMYIAALPLGVYGWIAGCLSMDGAAFWVLTPLPSVFFGSAVGRCVREFRWPYPVVITLGILLSVGIGGLLLEFLTLPQVYFFNHVWGTWPGPIYDETVRVTSSYLFFRWLTLVWIILLWVIPEWSTSTQTKALTAIALVSLCLSYLNLDEMGIITPRERLKTVLSAHGPAGNVTLYADPNAFSEQEQKYWSAKHAFYFDQIIRQLEIDNSNAFDIESYLYAHAWQKKTLVGAKFTSYVPIWLEQDQLHMEKQALPAVLKHELVHAVSKQFGNALFHGSGSMGMIEGIAEGIAKDASPQSTLHQIIAAEKPFPSARDMRAAFSFAGFYSGASAISYTTAGSFVEFLMSEYPVSTLKEAYRSGDIEQAYERSFEQLVEEWHMVLERTPIDSTDRAVSEFVFAQRSLFQKSCPHAVSESWELWDEAQFHATEKDTAKTFQSLEALLRLEPDNELVKREFVRTALQLGRTKEGLEVFSSSDTLLTLSILKADALFLHGSESEAIVLLDSLAPLIAARSSRNFKYSLDLRADSATWTHHLNRRYKNQLPLLDAFQGINNPNQMLDLSKALELEQDSLFVAYTAEIKNLALDWFDLSIAVIDRLVFLEQFEQAQQWIDLLSPQPLRLRYRERLNEQQEWLRFVMNHSSFFK